MDIAKTDSTDCGNGAEVVLYQPDSSIHIEVLVERDTSDKSVVLEESFLICNSK